MFFFWRLFRWCHPKLSLFTSWPTVLVSSCSFVFGWGNNFFIIFSTHYFSVRELHCLQSQQTPPGKLTWNPKMDPEKRRVLLENIIFRFQPLVCFQGCNRKHSFNAPIGSAKRWFLKVQFEGIPPQCHTLHKIRPYERIIHRCRLGLISRGSWPGGYNFSVVGSGETKHVHFDRGKTLNWFCS